MACSAKAGYIGEFASKAVHDDPCWIEHHHVDKARYRHNEPDLFISQVEDFGAVERYDDVATTANGLGKELTCTCGDQVFAVDAKDVGEVAHKAVLRWRYALAGGFDGDCRDYCGHRSEMPP